LGCGWQLWAASKRLQGQSEGSWLLPQEPMLKMQAQLRLLSFVATRPDDEDGLRGAGKMLMSVRRTRENHNTMAGQMLIGHRVWRM